MSSLKLVMSALALVLLAGPAVAQEVPADDLPEPLRATFEYAKPWTTDGMRNATPVSTEAVLENVVLGATSVVSVTVIDGQSEAAKPTGVCQGFAAMVEKKHAIMHRSWTRPDSRSCSLSGISASGKRFLIRSAYLHGRTDAVVTVRVQYQMGVSPLVIMAHANHAIATAVTL